VLAVEAAEFLRKREELLETAVLVAGLSYCVRRR